MIDIYAYHRGREGRELRDEATGDLLYGDVEASDTNHHSGDKEPKTMTTAVIIKFPLEESEAEPEPERELQSESPSQSQRCGPSVCSNNSSSSINSSNNSKKRIRYYRERVQWNLADPETPNPAVFAAGIAQEFGLSYTQMLDLVESIQRQLTAFVQEQCTYAPAHVLRPQQQQQEKSAALAPHLYYDVTGTGQKGGSYHLLVAPKLKSVPPTSVVQRAGSFSSTSGKAAAVGSSKSGKNPSHKRKRPPDGSSSSNTGKVGDEFYQQVRHRLREASTREIQSKAASAVAEKSQEGDDESSFESLQPNELNLYENHTCHLCQQEQAVCGVFGCGDSSHAYCFNHLGEHLGLVDSSQLKLDYCPVCSLLCSCADCSSKMEVAAAEFKQRCMDQSATPETTVFDDLVVFCQKIDLIALENQKNEKAALAALSKKRRPDVRERRPTVPKLPISEFPREVSNGVDMDFGYVVEYQTRYTEKGAFPVTAEEKKQQEHGATGAPAPESPSMAVAASASQEPLEDGSVDFCNMCMKVGNLLCCDFCPRAFHAGCIPPTSLEQESADAQTWECPSCRREKEGLKEETLTGTPSLAKICELFPCPMSTKEDLVNLRQLSMLREMLGKLISYDFGYMFRSPVDCKQIPTYTTIVKKPMDLGTISANIENGHYRRELGDQFTLENVILAVLKDIELVWHNCCIFNLEGSAVYRMAEVQRRRVLRIRQLSFDHLLSERVKEELEKYVKDLQKEREEYHRLEQPFAQRRASLGTSSQARHKIAGPVHNNGNKGRPIAVLDPDTGMIVKIYTTIPCASSAMTFLINMKKHKCEWSCKEVNTRDKLRKIIYDCRDDPNILLYGYRWLFLEDLRNGSVVFSAAKSSAPPDDTQLALVQMLNGELSYFFHSIEEALSFPGLPIEVPDIRVRLLSLVPGSDYVEIAGCKWRILDGEVVERSGGVAGTADRNRSANNEVTRISEVAFVKEDQLAGGRSLLGFQTVEAAFEDWRQTVDASIFPYRGARTMEVFRSYYLDGVRNVDGIRWRSVMRDSLESAKQTGQAGFAAKNTTGKDDVVAESHIDNGTISLDQKVAAVEISTASLDQKVAAVENGTSGWEQKVATAENCTTGWEQKVADSENSTAAGWEQKVVAARNSTAGWEQQVAVATMLQEAESDSVSASREEEEEEMDALTTCLEQQEGSTTAAAAATADPSLEVDPSSSSSSSKVFDLETHSPCENIKPAARSGGIFNGLVRHLSPLVRMRAAPAKREDETPEKDSSVSQEAATVR